jgi:hypothetical protein
MSRAATAPADIHAHDCACATCEPYLAAQRDRATSADHFAMLGVAGLGVGFVLVWILDRLISGPGISVMWGA